MGVKFPTGGQLTLAGSLYRFVSLVVKAISVHFVDHSGLRLRMSEKISCMIGDGFIQK